MILAPDLSPRRNSATQRIAAAVPAVSMPGWLRGGILDAQSLAAHDSADVALVAGAAIGALDALVRRQERWAGVWRQRLALAAAAVAARQAGRTEDEAALRDTLMLARPGDHSSGSMSLGPGGLLLLAWHRLASRPVDELLAEAGLTAMLEEFGYLRDDEKASDLLEDVRKLVALEGPVGALAGAVATAERHGFGRVVGTWLADALLAQRLGWTHAVPLLGSQTALGAARRRDASRGGAAAETQADGPKALLAAQAGAALRAIDLFVDLERRAGRLLTVAPKLRAKGSDIVVDKLLSSDAVVASQTITGMSDRGLRRLFDRLIELGAVRELSGRPTFRIYGL